MARLFSCALLSLLLVVGTARAQVAPDQSGAQARAVAERFLDALDAGQWAAAAAIMDRQDVPATRLADVWTYYADWGVGAEGWRGPITISPVREHEGSSIVLVSVPLLRSNGHAVIRVYLKDGKPHYLELGPSVASFGPYAKLAGRAYVGPDGTHVRWYLSRTGTTVVSETRTANGDLDNIHVIKPAAQASLLMLRTGYCPGDVCGQVGSIADGVVTWKEPKAIGGRTGGHLDVRMWLEANDKVLATQIVDPAPFVGGPPTVQAPYRLTLVDPPQMSPQLVAQSESMVVQLESRVDVEVASALAKQLALRQAQDSANEERRRSSERAQSFNRLMGSVSNALAEADTGSYAEAQANLDATVANIQYAAAVERQQQHSSQQPTSPAYAPQRDDASPPQQVQEAAGNPLRFVMIIGMRNLPGDKVNSTCYSNVVTRDGPPGWGSPGFLPPGSGEQARQAIESLKAQFIAACEAGGRQISSAGNFNWVWNQTPGDEQKFASARAKYSEDVSVNVQ